MQKNWIYGHWLDSDSLVRCVGYRYGGRWVPLPFSCNLSSYASDIVLYGDTLYMGGNFDGIVLDKDSSVLPTTPILKFYKDSIWSSPVRIGFLTDFASSGDSLLIAASVYTGPNNQLIGPQILVTDGGTTFQYPYSIVHPTQNHGAIGGRWTHIEIRDQNIYTLNDGSTGTFNGVVRWDGQQWFGYGNGIYGTNAKAYDYEFHNNELYMGGSFTKSEDPRNPGQNIAKWNGTNWEEVGGGLNSPPWSLFEYKGVLYCHVSGNRFGDVTIPHLAGWDGRQWCGTPTTFPTSISPQSFGFINDTLYVAFSIPTSLDGSPKRFMFYYDGDYLHGPGSICSTLGLGEEENQVEEQSFSIYPNPSNGLLNISLPKETTNAKLSLYSLSGQLVFTQQLTKTQNQLKLPKGISGLYLVVVESAGQVFTEKVLLEDE